MAFHKTGAEIMNSVLWRIGAQIRSASSMSALQALFYRYLHPDFFFVQIGANDGKRADPMHALVKRHTLKGLAVEPLEDMFNALQRTYASQPQVQLANVGIHRTDDEITLYRVRPDADVPDWAHGIASSDPRHHERSGTASNDIIAERVHACSLSRLLSDYGVSNIDLFLTDTEGYDAEIIHMMLDSAFRPSIIAFEHSMAKQVMTQDTFCDLSRRLMANGYYVVTEDFDAVAYRPRQP